MESRLGRSQVVETIRLEVSSAHGLTGAEILDEAIVLQLSSTILYIVRIDSVVHKMMMKEKEFQQQHGHFRSRRQKLGNRGPHVANITVSKSGCRVNTSHAEKAELKNLQNLSH
jgi:hypothetical protein